MRLRSAQLFAQLSDEHSTDAERSAHRDDLVRLHLPLVEHFARRFLNRGEPLDDIEDLRIAVDEACAMVLPQARVDSDLTCAFDLEPTRLTVAVTAECDTPQAPDRDSFAWTVLSALTSEVRADVHGERLTIRLARGTDSD